MPIDNVYFGIEPINPDVYRFRVDFFDNGTKVSSSNPLIFVQTKAPNADGMNVDLFTKNATSKSKAKDVLKQVWGRGDCEANDLATIHSVREVVLPLIDSIIATHSLDVASKRQRLLVLDLNDSESIYANIDQIRACQKIVEQYLTAPCDKFQETYEALQQLDLQFMIGEGPLKYSLLRTSGLFDSVQQEFLTSKGNGKEGHCFLAEFLMNGFKFGQVAQLEGNSAINFQAQDYIDYIGKSSEPR
ncbi:MAG: hypothetical protein HZB76_04070, partial [Chlamydiae bacterium]|nr:hypothetical protein [Chlamydiota bacterium]